MLREVRSLLQKHKSHIPTAALVIGAVWDWLTLTRPDTLYANVMLLSYLVIASGTILLLNHRSVRQDTEPVWMLALMQFCMGNLASGLLVLYSQSATIVGSWLFLLVLAGFVLGNEFARERYARLRSHLIAYYVVLSAYLGLVVPLLVGMIGGTVFFLSMCAGLGIMFLYLTVLYKIAPARVQKDWRMTAVGIGAVFAIYNALYFTNFIPPVPLSLKDVGVYQNVERIDGVGSSIYQVSGEPAPRWYDVSAKLDPQVHVVLPGVLYCVSAVFTPDNLSVPIYHRWEELIEGTWLTRSRISFPIYGGRDGGFRGYTMKAVEAGKWRCSVETTSGELIGRQTFTVVPVAKLPELVTEEK